MAASMLVSSRCLSRCLSSRIFNSRSNGIKQKVLQSSRKNHSSCCQQLLRTTIRSQSNLTLHSGIFRISSSGFHSTSAFYSDVQVVTTPGFPESVSEGDIRWDKEVGDTVGEDDVIGEVETDKVSIPVPSPCAGVIEELLVADGDKVMAGMELVKIKVGAGGGAPAAAKPAEEPAAPPPAAAAEPAAAAAIPTTPPPTPPLPSAPMSSTPVSAVKPQPAAPQTAVAPTVEAGARTESRVKMNRMRQRIAQRLKEAQNTCAMLTTFNEIDMSNIMEMRGKYKEAFLKRHGIKLGFMSAFIKASATALHDQPAVNAVIDENEIVYRDYVDISVAVATPKGLVTPVLRNVGPMNYAQIEAGLTALGEKAKNNQIAIEDLDGGTFTISNGGVFGSMFGTPIINPPQSAILGMHGVFERPVAINGKVEIRPMMYVALTYDHRLVDGREAVTFLKRIKSAVEDPRVLLLDV